MSSFRTIEVSEPSLSPEHLRFVTVKSNHLNGRGNVTLFRPPDADGTIPLLVLLHGVYGSHWSWTYKGAAHETAHSLIDGGRIRPMAIAMPSDGLWGDGSGYVPHDGYDFSAWITQDTVNVAREVVEGVDPSSPLLIGGLSMGGFGALRIGCEYGDRFEAVSAHSSITHLDQMELFVEEPLEHYRQETEQGESVHDTIVANRDQLPSIRFDCGEDDPLIQANRTLHRQLNEKNIPHRYNEYPGEHEWSYWREHLRDTLLLFEEVLSGNVEGET